MCSRSFTMELDLVSEFFFVVKVELINISLVCVLISSWFANWKREVASEYSLAV